MKRRLDKPRFSGMFVLVFLTVSLLAILAGYGSYTYSRKSAEQALQDELLTVADLKTREISHWLAERTADAINIGDNAPANQTLSAYLEGDTTREETVRGWLSVLLRSHDYSGIALFDKALRLRLAVPETERVDQEPLAMSSVRDAANQNQVTLTELREAVTSGSSAVHCLHIAVPLRLTPEGETTAGVLLLTVDADEFLFPMIKRWPRPSMTAETVLVRRDGREVLFLNDVRHRKDAALNFRMPLSDNSRIAVLAASGNQGFYRGLDYRDVPVFAAIKPVSGSRWFLISKIDQTEALAPIHAHARFVILLVMLIVAASALLVALVWRDRVGDYYRSRYELERQRRKAEEESWNERQTIKAIMESSPTGIVLLNRSGKIKYANPRAEAVLGIERCMMESRAYNSPEWRITNLDGEPLPDSELPFPRVMATREPVFGVRHAITWEDGRRVLLSINGAPLLGEEGEVKSVVFAIEDVTERIQADQALLDSRTRFQTIFDHAPIGMFRAEEDGQIVEANPALATLLGCSIEELSRHTIWDFYDPTQPYPGVEELSRLFRDPGHEKSTDVRLVRADGAGIWVNLSVAQVALAEQGTHFSIGMVEDITARKAAEEQLRHDAHHDPLTRLPNRALLLDRLEQAIGRSERSSEHRFAVLFVDLDNFKTINDSLGHAAGDELLLQVSSRLRGSVRAGDTLARLGGDEFAVLLEGMNDGSGAWYAATRFLESLRPPYVINGHEVYITASVGVALAQEGKLSATELLRDADTAMYSAKRAGKNGIELFNPSMHQEVMEQLVLERELRTALRDGQFILHYQPIFDIETHLVIGAEALLRWNHPERGLLNPGAFIEMAETTGLIVPLGQWVLAEACRQAAIWNKEHRELCIHVNVSAKQVGEAFADQVRQVLEQTDLAPTQLHLEITESVLVSSHSKAVELLTNLRRQNVELYIDDFGTGYSSLAYLSSLPLSGLKLDRSFVSGIVTNPKDGEIARAVKGLASEFGLKIVAEGIETDQQLQSLTSLGYTCAQGFHLGKPMPAGQFTLLVKPDRTEAATQI